MKKYDFTNFSTESLLNELKDLSSDLSSYSSELITEAINRLELLSIEAVDLAHGLSKARQDANFWQEQATEAMNKSKHLEEAGDRVIYWVDAGNARLEYFDALNNWKQAKEAKP